jgi:hypothetical protein
MKNCPFSAYLGKEKMCEILFYTLDNSEKFEKPSHAPGPLKTASLGWPLRMTL